MIKCGISISGIEDKKIEEIFTKTLELFRKEGHSLRHKVSFQGNGYISIEGAGKDRRCAFCEYLRRALAPHVEKGEIALVKCPFYPDKRIDHTPETEEARKKLVEMFVKKHGERVVAKGDGISNAVNVGQN